MKARALNQPTSHPADGLEKADEALPPAGASQPLRPDTSHHGLFDAPTRTAAPQAEQPHLAFVDLKIVGFEIVGSIGQGGMGIVLEARQTSLDRRVAIKILTPELGSRSELVERFDREAATLARLTHPNIVTILERGRTGEHPYLIMEFVEGPELGTPRDLRKLIQSRELNERAVQRLMSQVASALSFAHSQGVIHRDIKPSNIMIDRHANAKVGDFGIASGTFSAGGQLTASLASLGTPDYMAPEQRRDAANVDHRADIYAAGVMLYEMLTGQLPLGVFAPPSEVVAVSSDWDAIIFRAMNLRPELRWQSMEEFGRAVDQVRPHGSIVVITANELKPAPVISSPTPISDTAVDGQLQSAKKYFDLAQADGPLWERFQHVEQAGLILAKVIKSKAHAGAQEMLAEVNQVGIRIARRGAKEALAKRELSTSTKYLEWLVEVDATRRDESQAVLQQIQTTRDQSIRDATSAFEGGKIKNAVRQLEELQAQFPDDPEIVNLLRNCRAQFEAVRTFLEGRFPQLRDERRYVELSNEIGRLRGVCPTHTGLKSLADQVGERLATADQHVSDAQMFLAERQVHKARTAAEQALSTVADHPDAQRLPDEIAKWSSDAEELINKIERLAEQGHCFSVRRLLLAEQAAHGLSRRLETLLSKAQNACGRSDRYVFFLIFVFVGGGLVLLSLKLAELFGNGVASLFETNILHGF